MDDASAMVFCSLRFAVAALPLLLVYGRQIKREDVCARPHANAVTVFMRCPQAPRGTSAEPSRNLPSASNPTATPPGPALPQVPAAALVGFLAFLGFALQTISLRVVSPGKSAFLTGVSIPLVPLLSAAIYRVRPAAWEIVGAQRVPVGSAILRLCSYADGECSK